MINRTVKFLSVALATLVFACGHTAQPPREPVTPPVVVVEPPKPAPIVEGPAYTLDLKDGWSLVHGEKLKGTEPMLLGVYENEVDENVTLVAGVVGIPLTVEQAKTFYEQMRAGAHEVDNIKVLKERMVKIDGKPAYEYLAAEATRHGVKATVGLVVTDGKVGYLVRCGGPSEAAQFVIPACANFVESFRIAK